MSSSEPATGELAARLVAARASAPRVEAELMLAGLGERLFGISAEPVKIGRFTVLRRLGAGGMGVVYLGHDGELDRKVAIKLLRIRDSDEREQASARLLREARALARVDHPNVIAVHEVGAHEGAVFVAMELVDGVTLATWQAERRSWREVVALYVQAGRGLAAAHAAGVIHRDFKPANVIVGEDGRGGLRVRVVDFGLACAADEVEAPVEVEPGTRREARLAATLTATGSLIGTPAYMAPEQFLGRQADARGDQFSFALALHEGLCGQRAFVGETVEALWAAVIAGRRRPMPADRRPPRWLRRIVDRALEVDPERRYPSMQALLDDLARGLGRGRRRLLALGGLALAGAAALAGRSAVPEPCASGADEIARVWSEPVRAAARAAFAATGKPFAGHAWAQTERELDAYAAAWADMHRSACEATVVHGEQSSEALDLRMRCLDRRRDELSALLAVFVEADERAVARAVEASGALTPVASCADLEVLTTSLKIPEDPRIRAPVATLRGELARAKALREAGHYDEGLALSERVHADALTTGFLPLRAETGVIVGSLHSVRGDPDKALAALDRAFLDALACDHAESAAWAAITATHAAGFVGRRGAEGRRWGALAEPLIERIGRDPLAVVSLRSNLGNVAFVEGALAEARGRFESALAVIEAELGPDQVVTARTLGNLAAVLRRTGEHAQALAHYRRAGEIFRARLGPEHPALATLANNTGALLQVMGDREGAARSYREVLALAGGSLSPTSPTLGHAHSNLAEVLLEQDEARAAASHYASAIEIWSAAHGAAHPLVAHALVGLGRAHVELGEADPALSALQRALEILRSTGASAGDVSAAQFERARALALASPRDPGEAIAAAQAAAEAAGPGEAQQRIIAWLHDQTAR